MLAVPTEVLHKAIAVLGTEGISDDEVEAGVAALAGDELLARRLIDCVPEAFGIVLASHVGKVRVPASFSARSRGGPWRSFPFDAEPIFAEAARIATDMYHSGDRAVLGNIAKRSAVLDVVNKALNAGDTIDGATLSGPALNGIPAEIYQATSRSPWLAFLRSWLRS